MSSKDESKIIWLTCPDCGSKIGIIISVGKQETQVILEEEKSEKWPPSNLQEKLIDLGIDLNLLNLEETDEMTLITPKKFLGDQWGSINDVIRGLNGTWVREGRDSHWEIKKEILE